MACEPWATGAPSDGNSPQSQRHKTQSHTHGNPNPPGHSFCLRTKADFEFGEDGLSNSETPSGAQDLLTVSESGRYWLVFRSHKPAALRFQDWVAGSIRRSITLNGPGIRGAEMRCPVPVRMPVVVGAHKMARTGA
jgi:prophage antirepressor-like protein